MDKSIITLTCKPYCIKVFMLSICKYYFARKPTELKLNSTLSDENCLRNSYTFKPYYSLLSVE